MTTDKDDAIHKRAKKSELYIAACADLTEDEIHQIDEATKNLSSSFEQLASSILNLFKDPEKTKQLVTALEKVKKS